MYNLCFTYLEDSAEAPAILTAIELMPAASGKVSLWLRCAGSMILEVQVAANEAFCTKFGYVCSNSEDVKPLQLVKIINTKVAFTEKTNRVHFRCTQSL